MASVLWEKSVGSQHMPGGSVAIVCLGKGLREGPREESR